MQPPTAHTNDDIPHPISKHAQNYCKSVVTHSGEVKWLLHINWLVVIFEAGAGEQNCCMIIPFLCQSASHHTYFVSFDHISWHLDKNLLGTRLSQFLKKLSLNNSYLIWMRDLGKIVVYWSRFLCACVSKDIFFCVFHFNAFSMFQTWVCTLPWFGGIKSMVW